MPWFFQRLTPLSSEEIASTVASSSQQVTFEVAQGEAGTTPVPVVGNLTLFVKSLGDEWTRALRKIDAHSAGYVQRIRDEQQLSSIASRVFAYSERVGDQESCGELALLQLEHMYYKQDRITRSLHRQQPVIPNLFDVIATRKAEIAAAKKAAGETAAAAGAGAAAAAGAGAGAAGAGAGAGATPPGGEAKEDVKTVSQAMAEAEELNLEAAVLELTREAVDEEDFDVAGQLIGLCNYIFDNCEERARARAMLCLIYYHAIHDRFYEARDALLVSHMSDHIQHMDESTQILYNRMLAQLGMAAFRAGLFEACQACLHELTGIGRPKELLAQGLSNTNRFQDRDAEREKQERRRQVPYHMHINLELLEACHLISAMILEVPNMAAEVNDPTRRRISVTFRKQLDIVSSKTFIGPPESTRDTVITAAIALTKCDWHKAKGYLFGLSVWRHWAGAEHDLTTVKSQLLDRLKREALRTFMLTYAAHYDAISHEQLCKMFELPAEVVHSVTSKMMIKESLPAAWDQPTKTIVMQKTEPTRLQSLALDFAEKVAVFVDTNERLLSAKTGGQFGDDGQNRRWGGRRRGRGGGGRNFGYYSKRGRGRTRRFDSYV